MAQARTDKATRPHVLDDQTHYLLLLGIFQSIKEQGLLTESVKQLGGYKTLVERGMISE